MRTTTFQAFRRMKGCGAPPGPDAASKQERRLALRHLFLTAAASAIFLAGVAYLSAENKKAQAEHPKAETSRTIQR